MEWRCSPTTARSSWQSRTRKRLTAFDVSSDGHLSGRRVWAQLEGPPDGICIDQEGAIWYADVPNSYCRRVKEGGRSAG
ncbi:SMP-30/gluconolactonase/LRE family protein [Bradyrhizobium sp. RDM4]|uniref:SMP-30/gluconolactonase/LRE family protein n=1 Tax=Bradyrhizobium sp. RDM4 TaxID=3378765 RepID=UPI0038FD300D